LQPSIAATMLYSGDLTDEAWTMGLMGFLANDGVITNNPTKE
jgi:hypothetical protein